LTATLSKLIRVSLKSSAGDGNPADTPSPANQTPFPEVSGVKNCSLPFFSKAISLFV
jgi:hypothetical protein